jgi:His-Xaa-Ser system protein HxsD
MMGWTVVEILEKDADAEALRAAAYVMTDRAFVQLDDSGSGARVLLRPKDPGAPAESLAEAFRREWADQKLRLAIAGSNQEAAQGLLEAALAPRAA